MAKQAFLTFREARCCAGNSDGASTNLLIRPEPVGPGRGANRLRGLARRGLLGHLLGAGAWPGSIWWQPREPLGPRTARMQEACGRAGGSQVTLPLVLGSGAEHRLSFWGKSTTLRPQRRGQVRDVGTNRRVVPYSPPVPSLPPTVEGSGGDPAELVPPLSILQHQWPPGDLPCLVDLLPSHECRGPRGDKGRRAPHPYLFSPPRLWWLDGHITERSMRC